MEKKSNSSRVAKRQKGVAQPGAAHVKFWNKKGAGRIFPDLKVAPT